MTFSRKQLPEIQQTDSIHPTPPSIVASGTTVNNDGGSAAAQHPQEQTPFGNGDDEAEGASRARRARLLIFIWDVIYPNISYFQK